MNNDLISRNALIQHAYSAVVDGVEKDIIDLSDVDNAPTVEPERPQGEWKPDMDSFYCDQCGVTALEINRKWYKSNFCPNCGADMKGGAE